MKILITGATGYVGNNVAHSLANKGHEIHAIARSDSAKKILHHQNIKIFKGDILDKETLFDAMKNCEQVYHVAAKVGLCVNNFSDFYNTNVIGTKNVIDAASQLGVQKTVFTSTCGVIGPSDKKPLNEDSYRMDTISNAYDLTKKISEDVIYEQINKGFNGVIVCPSKIYGPGNISHSLTANAVIDTFLKKGITIIPSPGTYKVCFSFIDDIVHGHILAMEKGIRGEKYILGGINISYQDFFNQLRAISSCNGYILKLSKTSLKSIAGLQFLYYKLTGNLPLFTPKSVDYVFNNYIFSSDKAINQLGYKITPLNEAMEKTIHYLMNNDKKVLD
ncbi:NAD-dependent epimerase/dehydratase family protein [Flavobacterium sp. H122]|uniref:NAD-dependent epimerase/dehydratase family protein n=1 Tax=Flavobacterium sp. H122 TaxID=2529860 RepID=UPI0010AAE676|nr:NAD-dependent epimerase/dehydratase family protein [Flavobacterium sp. H122]